MSSWKPHIDNMLHDDGTGSNPLEKAAICGINPPSIWTKSDNFNFQEDEIKFIAKEDKNLFASNGVKLSETKFMMVKEDLKDDKFACLQLRSSNQNPETSNISATVGKTNMAYVIGVGFKDVPAGKVSARVFKAVEYLKSLNY